MQVQMDLWLLSTDTVYSLPHGLSFVHFRGRVRHKLSTYSLLSSVGKCNLLPAPFLDPQSLSYAAIVRHIGMYVLFNEHLPVSALQESDNEVITYVALPLLAKPGPSPMLHEVCHVQRYLSISRKPQALLNPNQSKNSKKEGLLLFLYSSILYVKRKGHSLRSPSLNPLLANELLLVLIILARSTP